MEELEILFRALVNPFRTIAELMYGCGLRISEAMGLRIKDLDFSSKILTVRQGKGKKDRTVPLPESLIPRLHAQIQNTQYSWKGDTRNEMWEGVFMPDSLEHYRRDSEREFGWYWLFPARELTETSALYMLRRYHLHDTAFQRELQVALKKAGVQRRVTAHTLRHTFATHLLRSGYDIRQVQDLMGHTDVRTTMIYTHVLRLDAKPLRSPLDIMRENQKEERSK